MNKQLLEIQKKTKKENEKLLELWDPILNHPQMPSINDDWTALNTAKMLNNMKKYLKETTFSGDIAQFAPILIPLVRRTLPGLIANELVGVQPMNGPVGQVYALRYGYVGEQKQKEDMGLVGHYAAQTRMWTVKKEIFEQDNPSPTDSPAYTKSVIKNSDGTYTWSGGSMMGKFIIAAEPSSPDPTSVSNGTGLTIKNFQDNNIHGVWKIILQQERKHDMVFLTVAYPVGTLDEIYEIPNMFPNEMKSIAEGTDNNDYKHYKVKKHVLDEYKNLPDTAQLYFAEGTRMPDPSYYFDSNHQGGPGSMTIYKELYQNISTILPWRSSNDSPPVGDETELGYMRTRIKYGLAEAGYLNVFKEYSGPYPTHKGEMLGYRKERRKLGLWVEKQMIEARTRYLQANYSIEAEQDMRAMFQVDLNAEFMNILSYEIGQEVDREIIDILFQLAEVNGQSNLKNGKSQAHKIYWKNANLTNPGINDFVFENQFYPQTTNSDVQLVDVYRRVMNEIIKQSNGIGIDTQRGNANWMLVSPNVAVVLEALQNFNMTNITGDVNSTQFGIGYIGTINGGIKIYKDILNTRDKEFALMGYKGSDPYDSGIVYTPYIPLQIEQVQNSDTLEREIIFQTRYDIADNIIDAEKYYRLIEFDEDALDEL